MQNVCVAKGSDRYSGAFTATTHVVVGGGGARPGGAGRLRAERPAVAEDVVPPAAGEPQHTEG